MSRFSAQLPTAEVKQPKSILFVCCLVLITGAYLAGAFLQGFRVNLDPSRTDQLAYMAYAIRMYETNYQYVAEGARMPVYPFLQSLLYSSNSSASASQDNDLKQFFVSGKIFNIVLSVFLLILIYFILKSQVPIVEARILTLITAFTVFIYKAGYFQPELLFYFLNFCTFLLLWSCIKRPRLWVALVGGVVAALAHLTKASIPPTILLFVLFYSIHELVLFLKRNSIGASTSRFPSYQILARSFLILLTFVLIFLTTVYPYLSANKKVFGQYFYNVNSNFYLWYDSWKEVEMGTRAHGDRVGWPQMPSEELPSFHKYLREHTVHQIMKRFINGVWVVLKESAFSYGYAKYFLVYTVFCFLLIHQNSEFMSRWIIAPRRVVPILFCTTYVFVYLALCAWWTPITKGVRLPLAHYLPAMFIMLSFITHPKLKLLRVRLGRLTLNSLRLHYFLIGMLILDVIFQMPYQAANRYAGE